jgi:chromosome segregation ATPase
VTLTGEIVDPWGAVTGGAVEAGGTGMLRKRREIKDLESEVAGLGKRVTAIEEDVLTLEAAIDIDTRAEARLSDEVHKAELELLHREKDASALREETVRTESRAALLAAERSERAARRTEFRGEIDRSSAMLRDLEDGHSSAQASIETLQRELAAEREDLERARTEITDIRMVVTSFQEKQAAAAKGLEALALAGADLADRLRKREAEIGEIAGKVREFEAAIAAAEEEIRGPRGPAGVPRREDTGPFLPRGGGPPDAP